MSALDGLIAEERVLAGDASADLCASLGHDWKTDGGRICPFHDTAKDCNSSQAVYKCARCDEFDYGQPGGPGYADCHDTGGCR